MTPPNRKQKEKELDAMRINQQAMDMSHSELKKETQQKIVDLSQKFKENVEDIKQILLHKVSDVDISVPDTYKQRGASARGN